MKVLMYLKHPVILVAFMVMFGLLNGCGGSDSNLSGFDFYDQPGSISGSSVILAWQAPQTNEDGTSLSDLAGYRVYYGEVSGFYSEVITLGNYNTCSIDNLPLGNTIYFAITAFDTYGNESGFSNEVSVILTGT